MNYLVHWKRRALDGLAAAWLATADREAVRQASDRIDAVLGRGPLEAGEDRRSSVDRILFDAPLWVKYEVIEDDKKVIVQAVWLAE